MHKIQNSNPVIAEECGCQIPVCHTHSEINVEICELGVDKSGTDFQIWRIEKKLLKSAFIFRG
jgi:hypothetical protein